MIKIARPFNHLNVDIFKFLPKIASDQRLTNIVKNIGFNILPPSFEESNGQIWADGVLIDNIDLLIEKCKGPDYSTSVKDKHFLIIIIQEFCIRQKEEWNLSWYTTRKLMNLLNFIFMLKIYTLKMDTQCVDEKIISVNGLEFQQHDFIMHIEILFKNISMTDLTVKENLSIKYAKKMIIKG